MSTEYLTPEEIIEKKYLLRQLCQNTKWRLLDAMEEYAAQQVEQQTKQLREERDKSKQLLERWLNVRERQMKGDPTMLSMESIQIETRDFLKHLNQNNEG